MTKIECVSQVIDNKRGSLIPDDLWPICFVLGAINQQEKTWSYPTLCTPNSINKKYLYHAPQMWQEYGSGEKENITKSARFSDFSCCLK